MTEEFDEFWPNGPAGPEEQRIIRGVGHTMARAIAGTGKRFETQEYKEMDRMRSFQHNPPRERSLL